MMIIDKAIDASCSGVWLSMSGIQLLVTIVIHSFTMGKRETSYSETDILFVFQRGKMQFVLRDLRVSTSTLLGKLF